MPLDSFLSFAEGDIEKNCRIDWDSFRQKECHIFVQIVHSDVRRRAKPPDMRICVYAFGSFTGYDTGNGTGTGCIGFSGGKSYGLSGGLQ